MQREYPRDRWWRGRDEEMELWGRDMDRDDWMRGTYGVGEERWDPRGGWRRGPGWRGRGWEPTARESEWSPSTGWGVAADPMSRRAEWERHAGPEPYRGIWWTERAEPWRGDRDWAERPMERRHWHGRTTFRNYRRSDERIREDVYERLMDHPGIDTSDMDVSVSNGEVTLEGTVDDRWEKRLAEDVAESVSSVTEVHNRLRTASSSGAAPTPVPAPTTISSPRPTTMGRGPSLREGMQVVGVDGQPVGRVKEVGRDEFVIDRPMARDVYAPMLYVQNTLNEQVVLSIPAGQVDHMHWRNPDIVDAPPPATGTMRA